jgi:hypothetical protein
MLLEAIVGAERTDQLFRSVTVPPGMLGVAGPSARVPRAQLAMAVNLLLFEDLVQRVPQAQAYVADRIRSGGRIRFDHGALRTVKAPSGFLPAGEAAITRLLEPLGYHCAALYPLERLRMTGRAYAHQDFPEDIPQFFLSEFHPETFSPAFRSAVDRILATSRDPLPGWAGPALFELQADGAVPFDLALRLLPNLVACFRCQHQPPLKADYQILLKESEEMAWIATEGNAFNHVTDRVPDVEALAREQKALGRPMKETVERSASGRVLQTAFRAAQVERPMATAEGHLAVEVVPGSFFEFITRAPLPDGSLDLGFDTSNAQAIFKMTAAAPSR